MLSPEFQIANYDTVGNMHGAWGSHASCLLEAAKILKTAFDAAYLIADKAGPGEALPAALYVHPTEIMLRGFALECFFKALWLKRGNKLAKDGKFLGISGVGSHELVQLADRLEFKCTGKERDMLGRLSIFVLSIGRYPIPTEWSRNRIRRLHDGGFGPPTYWGSPADDAAFDRLVRKIETELDTRRGRRRGQS